MPTLRNDQVSSDNGAFEFERHFGSRQEPVSRTNVMEEAREVICFVIVFPFREVGFYKGGT